ncbi:transcription elongation factor A N-terminal and central domain-containing protein [Pholidichthys leucotaenia]
MDTKELVHCARQIDKFCADRSYGDILTLLGDLDQSPVTSEQLENTDIAKVLHRLLKTCSNDCVKRTAKGLLSKWKRQYSTDRRGVKCTEEREGPGSPRRSSVALGPGDVGGSQQVDERRDAAEQQTESSQDKAVLHSPMSVTQGASPPTDSIRNKCVQLLLAALRPDPSDQKKAAELAGDVERHLQELHPSNQAKYKACVRSKVANLRNPQNGHLRQGLLSGSLPAEAFARMSAEEMASAELRQLRREYSAQGVSERQLPGGGQGTRTHKIHCKRCGGWDCRVTQVPRGVLFLPAWVRRGGADEDALTFVTCGGCGQQWYHSSWVCL